MVESTEVPDGAPLTEPPDLSARALPVLRAAPGLARVAVSSWWRATTWSVETIVGGGTRIARRAMDGDPPATIASDAAADLRSFARRALGLADETVPDHITPSTENLQERGADLLRRSADVADVDQAHPAYARILSEVTPDEARIVRYLFAEGPQPAVDVRTNRPLGVGSELVAGGLNMVAEHAGCRHVDRIQVYLTNLSRLGLVEFSREQVANPNRYQLVEAQPNVAAAMKRAGRSPKTVHRSIHLNEFGEQFCRICLSQPGG